MVNDNENEQKAQVVRENLDYLVRFAFFRTGHRELAEDLVHDAVVRFIEHRHPPVMPENMRAYLFRIVYNLCQESANGNRRCISIDEIDVTLDETEEERLDMEEAERINSILDAIPERQAEIVRMNVVDGLSFVESSRILSVPASTLKSRFKAGMDKLIQMYFNK